MKASWSSRLPSNIMDQTSQRCQLSVLTRLNTEVYHACNHRDRGKTQPSRGKEQNGRNLSSLWTTACRFRESLTTIETEQTVGRSINGRRDSSVPHWRRAFRREYVYNLKVKYHGELLAISLSQRHSSRSLVINTRNTNHFRQLFTFPETFLY